MQPPFSLPLPLFPRCLKPCASEDPSREPRAPAGRGAGVARGRGRRGGRTSLPSGPGGRRRGGRAGAAAAGSLWQLLPRPREGHGKRGRGGPGAGRSRVPRGNTATQGRQPVAPAGVAGPGRGSGRLRGVVGSEGSGARRGRSTFPPGCDGIRNGGSRAQACALRPGPSPRPLALRAQNLGVGRELLSFPLHVPHTRAQTRAWG